jgi:tripartite-type tricarboxylate transporter receptor subunit TctC
MRAGFEGVHVPHKGNSQVVMNLVGGQIQAGFLATPGVLPHVQDGRLKALAISSAERATLAADIQQWRRAAIPVSRSASTR